jgi:hypothetical protein
LAVVENSREKQMDSKLYRAMTALLWLALPLTGLQYWSVWDQLPTRMATHFGASGQPNGWMPRETSLIFALVVTVLVLVALTWTLTRVRKPDALAWSGFHYRFSGHGIEISTLGFRLRSIPLQDIKAYAVAPWNPMGGYGIRGIGERRAYVWGNTGVRLMLSDGEVFLGHREPEKIMNDLNLIRQNQKARENT